MRLMLLALTTFVLFLSTNATLYSLKPQREERIVPGTYALYPLHSLIAVLQLT